MKSMCYWQGKDGGRWRLLDDAALALLLLLDGDALGLLRLGRRAALHLHRAGGARLEDRRSVLGAVGGLLLHGNLRLGLRRNWRAGLKPT